MKQKTISNLHNLWRRGLSLFLAMILLAGIAFSVEPIQENIDVSVESFNMVLLIDKSGSMNASDSGKLVPDAAQLFVDLCDEGSDSRISVMPFNTQVNENAFYSVSTEEGRNAIKQKISEIEYTYSNSSGTDLGRALLAAVNLIKNGGDKNKKDLILLFTDGQTEDLDMAGEGRTLEDSERDFAEALNAAIQENITIYSIGANAINQYGEGSISQRGKEALESICKAQKDAGSPIPDETLLTFFSYKPDEQGLEQIIDTFQNIYADIGNRIVHHGKIEIKSPNVTELNIVITSNTADISSVDLTNPSGSAVALNLAGDNIILDDARVCFYPGKAYQLIKILEPVEVGEWKLKVVDKNNEEILSYSWTISQKTEITMSLSHTDQNKVIADVVRTDANVETDGAFYTSLVEKKVSVKDPNGNTVDYELTYNAADRVLRAEFIPTVIGTYYVTAHVSDGYFFRSCAERIEVTSLEIQETEASSGNGEDNENEEKDAKVSKIRVWNWFSKEVDVADLCSKQDVRSIESVVCENKHTSTIYDNGILKIDTLSPGKDSLIITAVSEAGEELTLYGTIKVRNTLIPLLILGVVALLALVVLFTRSRRGLETGLSKGYISIDKPETKTRLRENLGQLHTPMNKRSFTMYDVLKTNIPQMQLNQPLVDAVNVVLKDYRKELSASKFTVEGDRISVFYKSDSFAKPLLYQRGDRISWNSSDAQVRFEFNIGI